MEKKKRDRKKIAPEERVGITRVIKVSISDLYFSLKKEKFPQLVVTIVAAIIIVSALMVLLEGGRGSMLGGEVGFFRKFATAIYYGLVTITTVGYGDYSPSTPAGRFVAIILMLFGIAFFSMVTATVASIFVERKIMEGRGLIKLSNIKGHIVLCGWKKDMAKLLNEILAINKWATPKDFVIVANITPDEIEVFRQQNPLLREVHFLRGEHFNENILKQANIGEAKSAYILADESTPASVSEIDSKTVMAAMAIGSMTKNVHVCAELLDIKFRNYLESAHVSEIIFSSEYSRFLIANSSVSIGITKVINELLDVNTESLMYTQPMPQEYVGRQYSELKEHYSKEDGIMLVGLIENVGSFFERKNDALREAQKTADISLLVKNLNEVKKMKSNQPAINPPDDYKLSGHTLVILIRGSRRGKALV
ncbi:MAG: ion channel [bacterium]